MGLAAVALLGLAGCQQNNVHQEWRAQADERWLNVRSALMLEMAQQYFDTGDLDQAAKTVKDALRLDPNNAGLYVLAGRISLERGQLERSYHLLNMAIEHDETLPQAHYYQGLVLQRWQQYDEALTRYQRAIELEADNIAYLLAAGEMLVELDRRDEAMDLLQSKLTYFDQNASIRAAIGHLYAMQGRPDQAVRFFRQASLLDPESFKFKEELSLALLAAGQNQEAVELLKQLVEDPQAEGRRDLQRALAQAQTELGRIEEARAIYLKLARSEPSEAIDWVKLAELAWRQEDLEGTLYAAGRAISLAPQQHEGYLLAGMVWHKRKQLSEALRMFDRAAELAPNSAEPLILRGLALQQAGHRQAAVEAYEEALQRQPQDTRAQRLLQALAQAP